MAFVVFWLVAVKILARAWPNGSFSIWAARLSRSPEGLAEASSPLGLSEVSKTQDSVPAKHLEPRVRRGGAGITRYGRLVVENAAWVLERRFGPDRLSFFTATLPPGALSAYRDPKQWSECCRRFRQYLSETLARRGLPPHVVYVVEVQPLRQKRDGGVPLHLHAVFVGRLAGKTWGLTPEALTNMWGAICIGVLRHAPGVSYRASCNVVRVKRSAASYLGKYLSKGGAALSEISERSPECVNLVPNSWWGITKVLRRAVIQSQSYGEEIADKLEAALFSEWSQLYIEYYRRVPLLDAEGVQFGVCEVGVLTAHGRRLVGLGTTRDDFYFL